MCGIFAYLNNLTPKSREDIINILINGLKRLEYKGYDSAGIAIDNASDGSRWPPSRRMTLVKRSGQINELEADINELRRTLDFSEIFKSHAGLAHTRWATHGQVTNVNSHPQRSDPNNEFVVIHNGIITNYQNLKAFLMRKGFEFESETDTEAIAKLMKHLHDTHKESTFRELVEQCIHQLEGAFALVFKSSFYPGEIVCARRGSPLLIGVKSKTRLATDRFPILYTKELRGGTFLPVSGSLVRSDEVSTLGPIGNSKEVEYFISSDESAIIEHTNQVIYLEDDDVAAVFGGQLTVHRIHRSFDNEIAPAREIITLKTEIEDIMKGEFRTFMQKEIFEQAEAVLNTMRGRVNFETGVVRLGGLESYMRDVRRCRRLLFIACGTSYHGAIAVRQLLEELTELPVMIELASNFLDRNTPVFRDDVCFFLSQSGETADTLLALRYCKTRGALIVGVTNTVGSSVSRESHCGVHINAGPQIGVTSTKAYTSQIVSLVLFGLVMCEDKLSMQSRRNEIIHGLKLLPDQIREVLNLDEQVQELSKELFSKKSFIIIGRGYNFASCLEGALKIKELTYMHSEGIQAGELKHGPLALIDATMPLLMIVTKDNLYDKCMNALEQVTARHGRPILICNKGDTFIKEHFNKEGNASKMLEIPQQVDCLQSILTVIPLQLLALHIAELRKCNVDQPRGLLKTYSSSEGD